MMRNPLLQLLAPFKRQLFIVAALSFVTNIMMLVPTIYMLQLYDRVMLSRNTLTLLAVTLMVCFLLLMMALAEWLRSTVVIKSGVQFDQLYGRKIFSLAFGQFADKTPASQALRDLTQVRQFITGNGLFAFLDVPWSALYIVVLFVLNPVLGWLAMGFCAVQFGLAVYHQHSSAQPLKALMASQHKNEQFLQGKIRNAETLHVMGMLKSLYQRWLSASAALHREEEQAFYVQNRSQFINKLVRYTMQSLMLAVAAVLTVQGKISVGSMIASNVLIGRALQPFDVIVGTWRQYVQAKSGAATLNSLLSTHAASPSYTALTAVRGQFKLHDVGLQLSGVPVLRGLNVDIHPGRILNIMGASGSGKSTLARVLAGVVVPQQGQLLLDDVPIEAINPTQLAANAGYLPQQIGLLEGTIAENIARFGALNTTDIIAASQAVGLHEAILRLPQGYDTKLDANGLPLSGGQRQLLGLARAIYQQPQIIVLDEPNASLDEFGEAHLQHVLQQLKQQGKTIVVISHRSSLLKITDDLLILKNGEVAHAGPRDAGIAFLNQLQTLSAVSV